MQSKLETGIHDMLSATGHRGSVIWGLGVRDRCGGGGASARSHLLVFFVCIVIHCLKTCQSKKMAERAVRRVRSRRKGLEHKIEERAEEGDKAVHFVHFEM